MRWGIIALAAFGLASSAAARTHFESYEGRDSVVEGRGGTRTTTDGIDFWTMGDPPRRYQVIGVITDKRGTGLLSKSAVNASNVAKAVRDAGGDAAIILSSDRQRIGYVGGGQLRTEANQAFANVWAAPVDRAITKLIVVKYLTPQ